MWVDVFHYLKGVANLEFLAPQSQIMHNFSTIVTLGEQMLESLGYQVTPVGDSQTALQIFQAEPQNFDLVITDMSTPLMTGVALAQALLAIKPDLSIILCTGFSEIINRDKAKAIGIREYIMKPIIKRDMARVVRKVLDSELP